jgi:hypothetical protein
VAATSQKARIEFSTACCEFVESVADMHERGPEPMALRLEIPFSWIDLMYFKARAS